MQSNQTEWINRKFLLNRWTFVYIAAIAILAFCFQLGDIVTTSFHGYIALDCLVNGQMRDFYLKCAESTVGYAGYDPTIFAVFALWNLPVYAVMKLLSIAPNPGITAYWGRILITLCLFYSSHLVASILQLIGQKNAKDGFILFVTAPFALFSIALLGCYDIFSITLTLMGIRSLLKKHNGYFILFFALANCFKYLSAFVFIPLLLLTEKRFWHIIIKACGAASLVAFNTVIMRLLPGNTGYDTLNSKLIPKLFRFSYDNGFPMHGSVLVCGFTLLCIFAYTLSPDSQELKQRWILHLPLVAYTWLLLNIHFHAQWTIILCPFMVLNICLTPEHRRTLLLIEGAAFTAFTALCWKGCDINEQLIDVCSALAYVFHFNRLYNVFSYGTVKLVTAIPALPTIVLSVFDALLAAFAILTIPSLAKHPIPGTQPPFTQSVIIQRACCLLFFVIPTSICYILSYLYR